MALWQQDVFRLAAIICIALVGCSSESPPEVPIQFAVQGTVSDGSVFANAAVVVRCREGLSSTTNTTNEGSWSVEVPSAAVPCLVRATGVDGRRLHSVIAGEGITNLTPLTEAVVARTAGADAADTFAHFDAATADRFRPPSLAAAQQDVKTLLAGVAELGAIPDLITTPLEAGDAASQALVAAGAAVRARGTTLQGLATRLATGIDPAALRAQLVAADAPGLTGFTFDTPWQSLRTPSAAPLDRAVTIDGTILLRTELGMLRSIDEGTNWKLVPMRATATPVGFADRIVVAQGTDIYASSDRGATWQLNAQLPLLGYDAYGNAYSVDISQLYKALDGQLWAISPVRVNEGAGNIYFRLASTHTLDDWLPIGNLVTWSDLPTRDTLLGCRNSGHYFDQWAVTATELVVEYYLSGSAGPAVGLYDPGSGACSFIGYFDTQVATRSVQRIDNSDLLVASGFAGPWFGDSPGHAISIDGATWIPWPRPPEDPLHFFGMSQLTSGKLLYTGQHGPAPLLQTSASDGSGKQNLLRNVRWDLYRLASSGGVSVVVGGGVAEPAVMSGIVLASNDAGQTWNESLVFKTPAMRDVAANEQGLFVAVGVGGTVVYGSPAGGWKTAMANTDEELVAVASGGGRFVALTRSGRSMTSTDGANWNPPQPGMSTSPRLNATIAAMAWHDGRFVAALGQPWSTSCDDGHGGWMLCYGPAAGLWQSDDGLAWTRLVSTGLATDGAMGRWMDVLVCSDSLIATDGMQLARSTGRGDPWRFTMLPTPLTAYEMSADRLELSLGCSNGSLVVSIERGLSSAAAYDRVFVSNDQGATWQAGRVPMASWARRFTAVDGHWLMLGERDMLWRAP